MNTTAVSFLTVVILLVGTPTVHADWPATVSMMPNDQKNVGIVHDDDGGAIIAWTDFRGGASSDIYAQRLDEYGNPLWTINGVPICMATDNQNTPFVVTDGAGGAVIAWLDYRHAAYPYLYAQRVDPSGTSLWTTDGVAVTDASNRVYFVANQPLPADVIADGAAGAIVAWHDTSGGAYADINAQRIDGSGSVLWGAGGIAITTPTPPYGKYYPRLVSDDQGGAIVAWENGTPPERTPYAQRLNANGTVLWPAGGVPLSTSVIAQYEPEITTDGRGGAIVAWTDHRDFVPNGLDIYAQRVDSSGTTKWGADGVPICVAADDQEHISIAPDGYGGAFVVWETQDFGHTRTNISCQQVDSLGMTWPDCGAQITEVADCAGSGHATVVAEEPGAAVVVYDCGNHFEVQRVTLVGPDYWPYTSWLSLYIPVPGPVITAVPGGVIVAFADSLRGTADVYAHRVETRLGYTGHPEPSIAGVEDVPSDQGGDVVVSWDPSGYDVTGHSTITHYSVWRATNPAALSSMPHPMIVSPEEIGPDFRGPAFRIEKVGSQTYYWEWLANQDALWLDGYSLTAETRYDSTGSDPAMHYFQVVSHTVDQFVFWPSQPDSGYSVDNLSPSPPAAFVVDYNTGGGNHLTWDASIEPDVLLYRIYRSTQPDFVPEPANLIDSSPATEWFDPSYDGWPVYYKITAVDDAGNESDPSVPGAVTAVEDRAPAYTFALQASVPNPFNPTTRIDYSLDRDGPVSLRIFDVTGRLVAVLVNGDKERGVHSAWWNAVDRHGQPVAGGIYVYQLRSAGRTLSKKTVLIR